MRKTTIITLALVLFATVAFGYNPDHWTYHEKTTEMGETLQFAMVEAQGPDARTDFGLVIGPQSKHGFVLHVYDYSLAYGQSSVDIRVDDRKLLSLPAQRRSGKSEYLAIIPSQEALTQLMNGQTMKLRFESLSEGYIVHTYTLDNSAETITQVIGQNL